MNVMQALPGLICFLLLTAMSTPVQQSPGAATGLCATDVATQGYYISGGGDFRWALPEPLKEVEFAEVAALIQESVQRHHSGEDPAEPVVILLVDEFSRQTPSPRSEAGYFDPIHGEFVYRHIEQLLTALGFEPQESALPDGISGENWQNATAQSVTLVKVDYAQAQGAPTFESVQAQIDQAITSFRQESDQQSAAQHVVAERFVVNMSFVLLPCDAVNALPTWVQDHQGQTFEEYVAYFEEQENIRDFWSWIAEKQDLNFEDGNRIGSAEDIVFVAAAGNFGDELANQVDFRFYPGAWSEVLSVGSFQGGTLNPQTMQWEQSQPWSLSNGSEVSLPGGHFYDAASNSYYIGTSFAAPTLSLIAGLYLTYDDVRCPFDRIPQTPTGRNRFLESQNVTDFLDCPTP